MPAPLIVLLATLVVGGATAALAADTVTITLPADHGALAPGPGMEITRQHCQMCHSLDYITQQPRGGPEQWRGVVNKMMKVYGAPVPDGDVAVIADYLAEHYGPAR